VASTAPIFTILSVLSGVAWGKSIPTGKNMRRQQNIGCGKGGRGEKNEIVRGVERLEKG